MQRELEDAEARIVADLAVGDGRAKGVVAGAAGADYELADPLGVGGTAWVLGREPFVVVVVPVEDDVRPSRVEVAPEWVERGVTPMLGAGRKARLVPVREDALRRMRGEVVLEPRLLRGTG